MHIATQKGHLQIVQLLATCGATLGATLNDGRTVAIQKGHTNTVDFLQAVAAWPPLKIAVACRIHAAAKSALKLGLVDPAFTTATELATAAAKPAGGL